MQDPDRPPLPSRHHREQRAWGVRARQVLLPGGRFLENGAVWGSGDGIHGVSSWAEAKASSGLRRPSEFEDLGEVFLMPGLINAHCHLELGYLRKAIPPGLPFPGWLRQIVDKSRETTEETIGQAIRDGVEELRRGGCAFVADISRRLPVPPPVEDLLASVEMRAYRELLEFQESRATLAVGEALEWIRQARGPGLEPGLSPHAPYSTTLSLLIEAVRAAGQHRLPLCIHCDETPEEHRLWTAGDGPLREFLDECNVLPEGWQCPGCSPVEWLDRAGALGPPAPGLPGTLVVHLNAVTDSDVALLSKRGAAAVVCPGTHLYFQRGPFPLGRLLEAGIPTALGTDGLSSNDRLSMWGEMRHAAALAAELTAARVVELATSEAAFALGIEDRYGAIAPGKRAAFCVVNTPAPVPPLESVKGREWLLSPEVDVRSALVFGG